MDSVEIFVADNRLRPIWRFLLSVVLLFVAGVLTNDIVQTVFLIATIHHPDLSVSAFWRSAVGLPMILAAFKVMTAVFEGRPLGSMGLALHSRWGRELAHGMAVGAVMLLATVALEWGNGFVRFASAPRVALGRGTLILIFFAIAATNEEAIFRGYPFQKLAESVSPAAWRKLALKTNMAVFHRFAESITPAAAVVVSSGLFGLAHLANPNRTWISTLNTALVAVPFCIAYLRTRSLWMPIGMHFIWNFLMGFVLGLPVSGVVVPGSVLVAQVRGPDWMTGGQYGPEGSLIATLTILVGTAYLFLAKSIYTSGDMKALVSAPVRPSWPDPPITIFSDPNRNETKRD